VTLVPVTDLQSTAGVASVPPRALRLLAEVAHDIRSPLTSILFLVERMHTGQAGPITPEQERHLALVYTATFELNMLVNDLTELAHRGGPGLLRRERVCFSIDDMLRSVRDLVQPVAEERRLELRIEKSASDLRFGHPEALTRVLLNLVTNAFRVTALGSVTIQARDRPAACVEFSVRDAGPGLSAERMTGLFEPFATVGRKRRGVSSAGLGLAICRRLVHAMGGELAVESEVGVGTRFFFQLRLPRARTDCAPMG
jgi:signal transduction histidine kinase